MSPGLFILCVVVALPVFVSIGAVFGFILSWLGQILPGPALTPVILAIVGIPVLVHRYNKPAQPV